MSSEYSSAWPSKKPSLGRSPSSFTPREYRYDDYEQILEQVDLNAVFHKLEKYQSELQEVQARLNRKGSFSSREVRDFPVATLFQLELENLEHCEFEDDEAEPAAPPLSMLPPRKSSMHPRARITMDPEPPPIPVIDEPESPKSERPRIKKGRRPEPIVVPSIEEMPQHVQSATLPTKISSEPSRESDLQASQQTHMRHITVSESRGPAKNIVLMSSPSFLGEYREHELPQFPSFPDLVLPALSPSSSITTAKSSNPPATPLSLYPPSEDQIRREIELSALRDGGKSLVGNQYKHRAPPSPKLHFDDEDEILQNFQGFLKQGQTPVHNDERSTESSKSTRSIVYIKSLSKRRKSVFAVFRAKNEVDVLLDMYLRKDDSEEKLVRER